MKHLFLLWTSGSCTTSWWLTIVPRGIGFCGLKVYGFCKPHSLKPLDATLTLIHPTLAAKLLLDSDAGHWISQDTEDQLPTSYCVVVQPLRIIGQKGIGWEQKALNSLISMNQLKSGYGQHIFFNPCFHKFWIAFDIFSPGISRFSPTYRPVSNLQMLVSV